MAVRSWVVVGVFIECGCHETVGERAPADDLADIGATIALAALPPVERVAHLDR